MEAFFPLIYLRRNAIDIKSMVSFTTDTNCYNFFQIIRSSQLPELAL